MMRLGLTAGTREGLTVLCIGAHCDDIEIGCGGTILRLAGECRGAVFHWVVFSAPEVRATEAQRAAELFVSSSTLQGPHLKAFRDGFMPFEGAAVKEVFEGLKRSVSPDLILSHSRRDAHQDHRLLAELTWNTFRDHLILEYEIPKYDGDLEQPSVFVPLEADVCQRKIDYIMETFRSQLGKRWFRRETFLSLMRLRGMECNAPSGYAEAFYGRKLVL